MNILVTGSGLIGCHSACEMALRGHKIVLYDVAPNLVNIRRMAGDVPVVAGDIRDLPTLMETMQSYGIDTVFHSAAVLGLDIVQRPYMGMSTNVGGSIVVAEAARLSGVRRLVFASSFAVYNWGLSATAPISEEFPSGQDNPYSASKVACEHILRSYANQFSFEIAILRFARVYGWRPHAPGPGMHSAVAAAAEGKPVRLESRLFSISEYVYVKDVAQGVAQACEVPLQSKAFNIGTGYLASTEDVADAIRAVCPGTVIEVIPETPQGATPPSLYTAPLDLTRSRRELGYNPQYNLAKGIADFVRDLRRLGGSR